MKKILFTASSASELQWIKQWVKWENIIGFKPYFLNTWIWNYNSILNTAKFLKDIEVDFVVNIWICWHIWSEEKAIQVGKIKNFSNLKEEIVPCFFKQYKIESILSSEDQIKTNNLKLEYKYFDMESYWIEKVAQDFKIARIIIKVIYDDINKEILDKKNLNKNEITQIIQKNIDYKNLLENIVNYKW